MCSVAVRAEDTLYSDNDEFRAVRYTDSSGIATVKDKRAGSTERTRKGRNTGTDSSDFRIILCLRNDIAF
ncbi:hypothetical protein CGK76_11620 [Erysipelotrichaceae bacterium 7770_A6]|nr:hypothetical protein [Erysipelotrichaceae bacterium 7770_A6]